MKRCSKCGQEKPESEFHRDRSKRDGLNYWCKKCTLAHRLHKYHNDSTFRIKQIVASATRYKTVGVEGMKAKRLGWLYDLTPEQHKAMYLAQNGCCAICGEPVEYDQVQTDHDHSTGKVRGLLCRGCNRAIAIFDNHVLWEKAIQYIERAG